jgi:mannan endo-1,4-beta-mannosidase
MEPAKLDALARKLSTTALAPSRRGLLSGLAGGVAGLTGLALLEDADAKKKHKGKGKGKGKKKCSKKKRKAGKCGGNNGGGNPPTPYNGPVFTVNGRDILDTGFDPVLLRGVNKMSVFDEEDTTGAGYFPAIAATGANAVRIVWAITNDRDQATMPSDLATIIANCQASKMLPMIELHDATGDLGQVQRLADYWVRNDMLQVIFNAGGNLLVNIANEAGDETVTAQQFINTYTPVIKQMRNAGIRTPLVIDAPEWGKNLDVLNDAAVTLLNNDPQHNLIFSVHLYWGKNEDRGKEIALRLQDAVSRNYPLIVGEFSKWGADNGAGSVCAGNGEVLYADILSACDALNIGWYAWEWGPGNEYGDEGCVDMDMTGNTDATRNVLRNVPWVNAVVAKLASANPIIG